jgi:hypothetical protein
MLNLVKRYIDADVPVLMWGDPGTGKTASIMSWAEQEDIHVEVLIGSQIDPTDLGRPIVSMEGDDVILAPPPWARRIREALDRGQRCALFLDEFNSAPQSVQAALLRVANERKVAEVDLTGCRMIAAANPMSTATDASELSPATANRWAHTEWSVGAEDWIAGELSGWGHPDSKYDNIRALVTSWISIRGNALCDPPKETQEDVKGWPSPRSWSNLVKVLGQVDQNSLKDRSTRTIISSLVGSAMATEFISWVVDQDMPDPKALLDGTSTLPERGDKAMLAMQSVTAYAISNNCVSRVWPLCLKQRKDLGALSAKRVMRAAKASNQEPALTKELSQLIELHKEFR